MNYGSLLCVKWGKRTPPVNMKIVVAAAAEHSTAVNTEQSQQPAMITYKSSFICLCVCERVFRSPFFFFYTKKSRSSPTKKTSHKMHSDASLFTQSAFGNGPWNSEPIFHSLRLKCLVNLFLLELLCRWRRTEENEKIKNIFFFCSFCCCNNFIFSTSCMLLLCVGCMRCSVCATVNCHSGTLSHWMAQFLPLPTGDNMHHLLPKNETNCFFSF